MDLRLKPGQPIIIPRVRFVGPRGSRAVDLILDSGALFTAVSWDLARDVGYEPLKSARRARIVTANGTVEVPLVRIARVELGELKVKNVPVICHDIPELVDVEGLLGLSFLRFFRTLIDYRSGVLRID